MSNSELHVEAELWRGTAVLVMEGEATDRSGRRLADALYRVALARGLRLTTDLDRLDPRPIRGWHLTIDDADAITLTWPHHSPLLSATPLDLPPGWRETATTQEAVLVFAGYDLGMSSPNAGPLRTLHTVAARGALAAGRVPAHRVSPLPAPRVASSSNYVARSGNRVPTSGT
jgi:hypothetical protein